MRQGFPRTSLVVPALLLAVASAFAAGVASADAGPERRGPLFRIAYEAGPGCPGHEAFLRELHKRTADAVIVAAPRDATDFVAEVHEVAGGARGRLRARAADGRETTREVSGNSCDDVVGALALVAALSIEPRRSDAGVSRSEPSSFGAPPPVPAPPTADVRPVPVVPDARARGPASARGRRIEWALGAQAMLANGLGVESVFSGAVFLGVNDVAPWLASLRVTAGRTAEGERSAGWGTLRTQLVYAGLEACPVRLPRAESIGALACAGIEAGRLRVEGEVTEPGGTSRSTRKLWVDLPLSIRVEYVAVGPLALEVRGALLVPLTRYDLELIDPTTVEYSMPPVATMVGAGAGVRFH